MKSEGWGFVPMDYIVLLCYDCRKIDFVCNCFVHWHAHSGRIVYADPCIFHEAPKEDTCAV